MGLFSTTLDDIIDLLKKGKYKEVKDLLDEHMRNEHDIEGDLNELRRVLSSYQQMLLLSNRIVQNRANYKKDDLVNPELVIEYLEKAKEMINEFESIINRLQKEGKLAK